LSATVGSSNSRGLVRRRLRLTRNTEIPSILVECGYLSNKAEAARAVDSSYQRKIASAIARAIKTQASMGDSGMGALPKSIHAPPSKNGDHRE
jgi:N-acetylmuramoyl-L-alanine amidase